MIRKDDVAAVGKFQKTHALKGELNALLDIDPEFLEEGNAAIVETDGILVPYFASSVRPKGNTSYLVRLDGIDSEEEARDFVNKTIYGLRSELAPFLGAEEDDLATEDELIGYTITDDNSGLTAGTVTAIDDSTANLLFIIETPDGEEAFVPAAEDLISEISPEHREIRMRIPDGLIDLNRKQS